MELTLTDRLSDKLRAAQIIYIGADGHPHLDMNRIESLYDQAEHIIRATARRAFSVPMAATTEPIATAETKHISARQDYFALTEECRSLLERIFIEGPFLDYVVPASITWTHVAGMVDVRNQLRSVNDILFAEGSFAG